MAGGRNRLGGPEESQDLARLVSRFWDPQARFRLRIGPLSRQQFRAFLPKDGDAYEPLVRFTRFFVGEEFSFDIQLVLKRSDVPPCEIGGRAPAMLGWSSWLAPERLTKDPDDAVLVARVPENVEDAAAGRRRGNEPGMKEQR
jgi:type VI secretion system protein ImpH